MMRTILNKSTILATCMFLIAMLAPNPLAAQVDTGGITGTVTDPTGAVVSGAQITLTNPSNGVSQVTKSTSTGTYSFSGVRAGTYTLKGEASGFQAFVDTGLEVHIQNILTVDVKLAAGTVSQQVEVTAAAPLLQAENGSVGQTITSQSVNELPLQSRDWASLSQLSAGVTTAPAGNPSGDSGALRALSLLLTAPIYGRTIIDSTASTTILKCMAAPRLIAMPQLHLLLMLFRSSSYRMET